MTISNRLLDRIYALTAIDKTNGAYQIEEEFDGVRMFVEVEAFDRLGLLIRRIEARKLDKPAEGPVEGILRRQAQTVIDKITYLHEDLKIVEVDATSDTVQLRSVRPHTEGDSLYFYNVLLRGGNALSLERLRRAGGGSTSDEAASMNFSKELFVRLINDIVGLF